MATDKPLNPKDIIAIDKLPVWLVSPFVKYYQAIAHYLGNVKYGGWNWRGGGARVSVYGSALSRHFDAFMEGEWYDPTDGTPHLANAQACLNIIIDAHHMGTLIDDRPPSNSAELARLRAEFEALMPQIRERYKDKNPKHWTIADTPDRSVPAGEVSEVFFDENTPLPPSHSNPFGLSLEELVRSLEREPA